MRGFLECTYIEPRFRILKNRYGPLRLLEATTSSNWCGAVVSAPFGQSFDGIDGQWTVPTAFPLPPQFQNFWFQCAAWIGMDGTAGSGDVLQAGTDSETLCEVDSFPPYTQHNFVNYYAWLEWYPSNSVGIDGIVVQPGDEIFCNIFLDPDIAARTQGIIIYRNITRNTYTNLKITAPTSPPTSLSGNCAEWIIERPAVGGALTQLAPYGLVNFQTGDATSNGSGGSATLVPSNGTLWNMLGDDGLVISEAMFDGSNALVCKYTGGL